MNEEQFPADSHRGEIFQARDMDGKQFKRDDPKALQWFISTQAKDVYYAVLQGEKWDVDAPWKWVPISDKLSDELNVITTPELDQQFRLNRCDPLSKKCKKPSKDAWATTLIYLIDDQQRFNALDSVQDSYSDDPLEDDPLEDDQQRFNALESVQDSYSDDPFEDYEDEAELSMEIEEALLIAKAKPQTVAQIRAECKAQGLVYDQYTKKCRPSKRAPKAVAPDPDPVPSPPTSPNANVKPQTVAQIRAECKAQGLVYDQYTKKCRPSKRAPKGDPVSPKVNDGDTGSPLGDCRDMSIEGKTASIRLKYKNRKSPPYPAQECKGDIKEGNDGETYESRVNSAGVYTWRKYKKIDNPVVIPLGPGIPEEFMPIVDDCSVHDMWKKGDIIGVGQYGSTYIACKVSHPKKCDYVLKIQNDSIEFRNEVDALVALKHTGVVVKIYAAWTCNGEGFIIMEKVMKCKKPFFYRVRQHEQNYNNIVAALNVIDDEGWIHIDMHKGNVMCRKDGSIVLIDFGWAVKRGNVKYPQHEVSQQVELALDYDELKIVQNWMTAKNFAVSGSPEYVVMQRAYDNLMNNIDERRYALRKK